MQGSVAGLLSIRKIKTHENDKMKHFHTKLQQKKFNLSKSQSMKSSSSSSSASSSSSSSSSTAFAIAGSNNKPTTNFAATASVNNNNNNNNNYSRPTAVAVANLNFMAKTLSNTKRDLKDILKHENYLQIDYLALYNVDSVLMDKINGFMRDKAVFDLLCLHKAFFNLSAATFARSVLIVDHFVTKVRVKPKYMACVTTAAYYLACKLHEDIENQAQKDTLVALTQCGGTVDDLSLMIDIIITKLQGNFYGATAIDFVQHFLYAIEINENDIADTDQSDSNNISIDCIAQRVYRRILIAFTSLHVYQFRLSTIALAALFLETATLTNNIFYQTFEYFASQCLISNDEIIACAEYLQCYQPNSRLNRIHFSWSLSRKTRLQLTDLRSISPSLEPIIEDDDEKENEIKQKQQQRE